MASHADKVAIGLIQMSCAAEPRVNLDKAIAKIEEAAKRGAQIVCLQELFASHYFCQVEDPKFSISPSRFPARRPKRWAPSPRRER